MQSSSKQMIVAECDSRSVDHCPPLKSTKLIPSNHFTSPLTHTRLRGQLCKYVKNVSDKMALAQSHSVWFKAVHQSSCWDQVRSATLLQKHMLPDMHPLYSLAFANGKTAVFNPRKDESSLAKLAFIVCRATRLRTLNIHIDNFWFREANTRGQQVMGVIEQSFQSNAYRYFQELSLKIEMSAEILACVLPVVVRLVTRCRKMDISLMAPQVKPTDESLSISKQLLETLNSGSSRRCLKSLAVLGNVNEQQKQIAQLVQGQTELKTLCLMNGSSECLIDILSQVPAATMNRVTLLVFDDDKNIPQERMFGRDVPAGVWESVQQLTVTYQPPRARSSSDWRRWFESIIGRCPLVEQITDHLAKLQPELSIDDFVIVLKRLILNASDPKYNRPLIEVNLFKPRGIKIESKLDAVCELLFADKDVHGSLKDISYFGYTLCLKLTNEVLIELDCTLIKDVDLTLAL